MTGYAAVIIGIVIVMYSIIASSIGAPLGIKSGKALLSFGGFIIALGFLTAGFWSQEKELVRVGLLFIGGIAIIAMMFLI